MQDDLEKIRETLSLAVRQFERNGLCRKLLRRCLQEVPELFLKQGLQVLLETDNSAGYRFLALLLVKMPEVFQELTNRWNFTRDGAVKIATQLQRVEPDFDMQMVGHLPGRNNTPKPFALTGEAVVRALELLDEISPGRRIVPTMRHLTEHADSKISAKAVLLIGKRLQNPCWAKRVITESANGRLRANAIETLWGRKDPEVTALFRDSLRDEDNRATGNGIIGLHRAGDPEICELVANMAADPSAKLRMTAAWAMGQIGDVLFTPMLASLTKDIDAAVRRAALRSLRDLHAAAKRARDSGSKKSPIPAKMHMPTGAGLLDPVYAVENCASKQCTVL